MVPIPMLLLAVGCGEDTKPHPGYADPCATPMGAVLSCPLMPVTTPAMTMAEACRKLTACGILAERYVTATDTKCSSTEECNAEGRGPSGECLANSKGDFVCHYHRLDYLWCVLRFSELTNDPCQSKFSLPFTEEQVSGIVGCIAANGCSTLGASFEDKTKVSGSTGAENDKYICKSDGKTIIWTATICDGGLLNYDSHAP